MKIHTTNDERGFVLVLALVMMVVLSLLGIAANTNTSIELKIAANERQTTQRFFTADSGWKQAGPYLDTRASSPSFKNVENLDSGDTTWDWTKKYYLIVRNFGDGDDGVLNDDFAAEEDGIINRVLYWYRLIFLKSTYAEGYSDDFQKYFYEINSNTTTTARVDAMASKIYKTGYK